MLRALGFKVHAKMLSCGQVNFVDQCRNAGKHQDAVAIDDCNLEGDVTN